MKKLSLLLLLPLAFACGSSGGGAQRPADVAAPTIQLRSDRSVFFGGLRSAPVQIDLTITNNSNVVLRVIDADISSPGMMEYSLQPFRRTFNEELSPGETRHWPLVGTAVRQIDLAPNEPLTLRGVFTFGTAEGQFREVVQGR